MTLVVEVAVYVVVVFVIDDDVFDQSSLFCIVAILSSCVFMICGMFFLGGRGVVVVTVLGLIGNVIHYDNFTI